MLAGAARGLLAVLLACVLYAGCERPFQPYLDDADTPFSLFGYLDVHADTQWVRVMPVRHDLFLGPDPIDAVVTLERAGSGHVVTMRDSLFRYADARLGAVAYAHNYWTAERLEPEAEYAIRAVRSDGAATTARVVLPPALEFSLRNSSGAGFLRIRAARVVSVDVIYTMGVPYDSLGRQYYGPAASIVEHAPAAQPTAEPGVQEASFFAGGPEGDGATRDMGREEVRVAVANADWPYHAGLSDLEVTLPGTLPSNVEGGLGFVGGVATRTVPFAFCQLLEARPDHTSPCDLHFDDRSTTVAGRLVRAPCGAPAPLGSVDLTETLPAGGAIRLFWKAGWDGRFRFEGLEPGARLVLNTGSGPPLELPVLAPGQHHPIGDVPVPGSC